MPTAERRLAPRRNPLRRWRPDVGPAGALTIRSAALFLGLYTVFSLIGSLRRAGFDANVWWIDLHFLPRPLAKAALAIAAVLLLAYVVRPALTDWRRWLTSAALGALTLAALLDAAGFYVAWSRAQIRPDVPLPLSLLVAVGLALMARSVWRGDRVQRTKARHARAALVACAVGWALLFPLAQELFFGTTDYVRPAVGIVVLGAQVNPDGSPSLVLAGRVQKAAELYRQGRAPLVLLSGGGTAQVDAMRRLALALGVPSGRLRLDVRGINSQATVNDTVAALGIGSRQPLLIVSNFYHLPRLKLAYQRAGLAAYTVPAWRGAWIIQTPYLMAREVPAFWLYYLRAIF
jgi:vancomycin permeability regulator SanA